MLNFITSEGLILSVKHPVSGMITDSSLLCLIGIRNRTYQQISFSKSYIYSLIMLYLKNINPILKLIKQSHFQTSILQICIRKMFQSTNSPPNKWLVFYFPQIPKFPKTDHVQLMYNINGMLLDDLLSHQESLPLPVPIMFIKTPVSLIPAHPSYLFRYRIIIEMHILALKQSWKYCFYLIGSSTSVIMCNS